MPEPRPLGGEPGDASEDLVRRLRLNAGDLHSGLDASMWNLRHQSLRPPPLPAPESGGQGAIP